jgi:sensor c-di-GMP phosphodiesterase-like protein
MDDINDEIFRRKSQIRNKKLKKPVGAKNQLDAIKKELNSAKYRYDSINTTVAQEEELRNQQKRINVPRNTPAAVQAMNNIIREQSQIKEMVRKKENTVLHQSYPELQRQIKKERQRESEACKKLKDSFRK